MQLPKRSVWSWRRSKKEKSRLEKMVATAQVMLALTKGVVYVGVVLSVKPILKSWQLSLVPRPSYHGVPVRGPGNNSLRMRLIKTARYA